MTLPAGLTMVTVTGTLADVPTGVERSAKFTNPWWLVGSADNQVCPPFTINATIATDGSFSVELPATNDPAWSPAGWTYAVTLVSGSHRLGGTLSVPYDTVGSIDIADTLNPGQQSTAGALYLLASARGAAGGVAALDADGDVNDADGNKITGGGGDGGAVDSVNGQTGIVVITAAGLGAATTGALAAHDADTTLVHGIANTANLVLTDDARLSNARTPTAHAASHTDGGTDEISLDGSQITGGTIAFARLPTGTSGSTVSIGNHTHAGGGSVVTSSWTYFTAGDYPAVANGSFALVSSGPTITIPAVAGDHVELQIAGMMNDTGGGDFWEMVAINAGSITRFGSTGGAAGSVEGDPAFYPDLDVLFRSKSAAFGFTAASGDIAGGNITFGFAQKGAGNGAAKIYADTNYPLRMRAINYGQ